MMKIRSGGSSAW